MIGYLIAVTIVIAGSLLALAPIRRPFALGLLSWLLSAVINEAPVLGLYYLAFSTTLALSDSHVATSAVILVTTMALFVLAAATPALTRRSARSATVLTEALSSAWPRHPVPASSKLPWLRILALPLPFFAPGTRVLRGRRYGAHRRNRLDVYAPRRRLDQPAPVLIHLHGGGFVSGRKSLYARPMLHLLAKRGWLCVSASYRLRPATYPQMLNDVAQVLGWVGRNAHSLNADLDRVFMAGSSAGAHLALSSALLRANPSGKAGAATQPRVAGAIGMYGYYGPAGGSHSTPCSEVHADAPPVFIIHGTNDTGVPGGWAEGLVARLREVSRSPVCFADLPGAQHTFDLTYSLRFSHVVNAVEAFASLVTAAALGSPDEIPEAAIEEHKRVQHSTGS